MKALRDQPPVFLRPLGARYKKFWRRSTEPVCRRHENLVVVFSEGSELGRQVAVDLEADTDLNERRGCPGHGRRPSECCLAGPASLAACRGCELMEATTFDKGRVTICGGAQPQPSSGAKSAGRFSRFGLQACAGCQSRSRMCRWSTGVSDIISVRGPSAISGL